jgi:hypothetical protein
VSAPPTFSGAPSLAPSPAPSAEPTFAPQIKQCGNEMVKLSGETGQIVSGPDTYGPNLKCGWRIDTGRGVELTFIKFNTEFAYDFVRVYDGTGNPDAGVEFYLDNYDTQYMLSGTSLPSPISTTGSMVVIFESDQSIAGTGFVATFAPASAAASRLYLEPSTKCSGRLVETASTGVISSTSDNSNYGSSSDCSWLIEPADGSQYVFLQFSSFVTEKFQDEVRVYDGETTSSNLLAQFSGDRTGMQTEAMSSTGKMLVHFTSDASNTAAGFKASFQGLNPAGGATESDRKTPGAASSLCGGTETLRMQTGTFSSGTKSSIDFAAQPRAHYANDMLCTWEIIPFGVEGVVQLTFDELMTENFYDVIDIYDGVGSAKTHLGQASGTFLERHLMPGPFVASSGKMTVIFKSDFSTTAAGFTASFMARGRTAAPQETPAPGGGAGFEATNPPSLDAPCVGSRKLIAPSGELSDGPGQYVNMASCSWLIEPKQSGVAPSLIELSFNSFSLENTYDWLYVYDGVDETGVKLGQFTGGAQPPKQVALSGSMFVLLRSDGGVVEAGFSASYTSKFNAASAYYSGRMVADSSANAGGASPFLLPALAGVALVAIVGTLFGISSWNNHRKRKEAVKEWSSHQVNVEAGAVSSECESEMAIPEAAGPQVNMFVYSGRDASPTKLKAMISDTPDVTLDMKPKAAW